MRRAVGLLLFVFILAGCGNKGALYLPPPEKNQQQNSKSSPRQ
jgi:predicted small lipoprotein YifL